MHNLKKMCAIGLAIILGPLAFGYNPVDLPNYSGSRKAHKQLTAKVFEMLRTKQYSAAKKFLDSIPPCPEGTIRKDQIPAYCFGDWRDTVDVQHSAKEPKYIYRDYVLNAVRLSDILSDALAKHYRYLYGSNPYDAGKFDKENSVKFYKIYKHNTWLEPIVKENLFIWPTAPVIKDKPVLHRLGIEAYDTVLLAKTIGHSKESSDLAEDRLYNITYRDVFKDAQSFIEGAWSRAKETGDKEPFYLLKIKLLEKILSPQNYHLPGKSYNLTALASIVGKLGSEDLTQAQKAWEVVIIKPVTKKMKDNAKKMYDFCLEHIGESDEFSTIEPMWCVIFKLYAQQYGLIAPDTRKVAQKVRDRVNSPRQ